MYDNNMVFVDFVEYCPKCKHWKTREQIPTNLNIGAFNGIEWSGAQTPEEYYPCCDCLEVGARYGTEVPEKYEVKG